VLLLLLPALLALELPALEVESSLRESLLPSACAWLAICACRTASPRALTSSLVSGLVDLVARVAIDGLDWLRPDVPAIEVPDVKLLFEGAGEAVPLRRPRRLPVARSPGLDVRERTLGAELTDEEIVVGEFIEFLGGGETKPRPLVSEFIVGDCGCQLGDRLARGD